MLVSGFLLSAEASDDRQTVQLPDRMRDHMLANMRDHLLTLEAITRSLANEDYDGAAETAENRLGVVGRHAAVRGVSRQLQGPLTPAGLAP